MIHTCAFYISNHINLHDYIGRKESGKRERRWEEIGRRLETVEVGGREGRFGKRVRNEREEDERKGGRGIERDGRFEGESLSFGEGKKEKGGGRGVGIEEIAERRREERF